MTPFETAFPGFITACVALFSDLMPFGILLIVVGTCLEQASADVTPEAVIKIYAKALVVLLLLVNSGEMVNTGQEIVRDWLEQHIRARPENVAERYRERLREAQQLGDRADESFIRKVLSGDWYESIILAVLTLISWLAMAVLAFVYSIQRALLIAGWALSPILIPFIMIRPMSFLGIQHILRLLGIILWPVGLALAATFTDGLIDVIAGGTSFAQAGFGEAIGKGLTAILGIGVLAIWIIVSTLLAPILIQRLITGFAGPAEYPARGANLLSGAVVSGSKRAWYGLQSIRSSSMAPSSGEIVNSPTPLSIPPIASNPTPPPPQPADPTQAADAILKRQNPPSA